MSYSNGLLPSSSTASAQRELPGVGFALTDDGNYDIQNKKLTNVKAGTDAGDAVRKDQIDAELAKKISTTQLNTAMVGKISTSEDSSVGVPAAGKLVRYLPDAGLITKKLYIPDASDDTVIIKSDDQEFDDINLHIPNIKNYDGIAGRRKSNIVVNSIDNAFTGKIIIPSSNIIIKDGNNQVVINRADIEKLYGSRGGSNGIVNNKCVLYDTNGVIYANNYATKVGSNFVFLRSRNQSAWRSLYIPSLGGGDATIIVDRTNQTISGDKTFNRAVTMTQEGTAVNHLVTKAYVDNHSSNGNYLKTDGSNQMLGQINMGNHKVINVSDPTLGTDAVNKKYVDGKTKSIPSHTLTNTFKYVMDDINEISTEYGLIAEKIDDLSWSFHSNQQVLYFKAINDGSNNYRYRLGIQMSRASSLANTIAIEQLFTSQAKWNKAQITINGSAITIETYHTTTKFSYNVGNVVYYYTKTIVQLKKLIGVVHYLYYTTHIDNVTPPAPNNLVLYAVVYGVDSFLNDVDSSVYSLKPYTIVGGEMQMQIDLNMNNKIIKSIPNPISDSDAANKLYCDIIIYHYNLLDDSLQFHTNSNRYRDKQNKIFPIFYNLLETTHYNFIQTPTGIEINKINPNLILGANRSIVDYVVGYGLKLSNGTYLQTTDTFNQNSSFTFFISFHHDRTKQCVINWKGIKSNIRYDIINNQITINAQSQGTHTVQFPSRYTDKKLFLWICYDSSNSTYKMKLGDYANIATINSRPTSNFQSNRLEIDFNVTVNKIGFSKQFIDINSIDFYRIMMEEKRNGSYVA